MKRISPLRLHLVVFFSCLISINCWGQDSDDPLPDEESVIEEVRVTGSRIKRSNLDSPAPVLVFDAEELLDSGITTLGEFARYLPQNADNFSDSMTNGSAFRGSAAFNLRGIGLDATLTLVNGRRIAAFGASSGRSPFVDINSIPMAAIERIEILKDGASAIYGSEAVAGVVNIITRKRMDRSIAEGGYLTTTQGDGTEWDFNLAGGWNTAATSFVGTLSYFNRDAIYKRDRDWSSDVDLSDRGGRNGRSFTSSPPTAMLGNSGGIQADPACPEQTERNSLVIEIPGKFEWCAFNQAWYMTLQQPSERVGLTASLEHALSADRVLFAELLMNRNETRSALAPTPFRNTFVPQSHPGNPFGEDVILSGRVVDSGERGFTTTATTWRALAGVRGQVAGWEWETALMASASDTDEIAFNAILANEFGEAILGQAGVNHDLFYNPFGLDTQNDQAVIDYIRISGIGSTAKSSELTFDVAITGSFGQLAGGPIGAAFGLQARSQELRQQVDDENGDYAFLGGGDAYPLNGDRKIYSVFAEFVLPLHAKLEAQLAARYDHYSDVGSTTNPKIGLGWRPREELLIRATWGTSFRPPTFRELNDRRSEFMAFIDQDPHRCPATGAVLDCSGNLVPGRFQGNPNLQPDEGETLLFGLAWEPEFARGLELALDFWQVEHRERILESNDFFLAPILLEGLDPYTNPFIRRAPQTPEDQALGIPGIIIGTRDTYVNGDTLDTNGLDFSLTYALQTESSGTFNATLNYSYLNDYYFGTDFREVSFSENFAGAYGFTGGLPRHRGNLRLRWNRGNNGLSAMISYAGDYESWRSLHVDGVDTGDPFIIGDYIQLDLQYSHVFTGLNGGMLRLGCRNCTDADPPVYNQTVDSEGFHEGRGAMIYLRWSQPF